MPLSEDIRNVANVLENRRINDKPIDGGLLYDLINTQLSFAGRCVELERRIEDLEIALCGDRQAELRLGRHARTVRPAAPRQPPALLLVVNNEERGHD